MRHGQAEFSTGTDAQRSLTPQGQEQAVQAGLKLKQAGFTPQIIFCSPLLRAQQSAQLAGQTWGLTPVNTNDLDGHLSATGVLDFAQELFTLYDCAMLVGHNPNISLAAGMLSENYISFRPGDCAVFDVTDLDAPTLLFRSYHDDI